MTKDQILLFDLGDTLFFRNKPHIVYDAELINRISSVPTQKAKEILLMNQANFPGMYQFDKDNEFFRSLTAEDNYIHNFFSKVFSDLKIKGALELFLEERKKESRYSLFPNVFKYLSQLHNYFSLGCITNGRPSRKRVLQQLEILPFFDPAMIFISDEIGCCKPNKDLFSYVDKKISSLQKTISFFDDEQINLDVAKNLGWRIYLVDHKNKGFEILNIFLTDLDK